MTVWRTAPRERAVPGSYSGHDSKRTSCGLRSRSSLFLRGGRIANDGAADQLGNAWGEGPGGFSSILRRWSWLETGVRGQGDHLLSSGRHDLRPVLARAARG